MYSLDLTENEKIDLESLRIFLLHSIAVSALYLTKLIDQTRKAFPLPGGALDDLSAIVVSIANLAMIYSFECFKLMMIYTLPDYVSTLT